MISRYYHNHHITRTPWRTNIRPFMISTRLHQLSQQLDTLSRNIVRLCRKTRGQWRHLTWKLRIRLCFTFDYNLEDPDPPVSSVILYYYIDLFVRLALDVLPRASGLPSESCLRRRLRANRRLLLYPTFCQNSFCVLNEWINERSEWLLDNYELSNGARILNGR